MTLTEAQDIIESGAPLPDYAATYRGYEAAYLPQVCALVNEQTPGRVLEVGPGWGTMMLWMAEQGWQVEVCDMIPLGHWITPELLARAGATFHLRDIFTGPLEVNAYDLVLMTQVLPHLKFRPDKVVSICNEMLKPGGRLIVTALDAAVTECPTSCGCDWRAVPEYGPVPVPPEMVVCLYTEESLDDLLRTAFAKVTVWQDGYLNYGVCVK